ncbi:flippase [Cellulophaga fucicola]|uniref:flippase n=1 Tax=Cellulophaga fucicola TaxID=76595 RepID=UPI003EB7FAF8
MSAIKALKSVSLLWVGSLLGSGSTFAIYTILAREMGPEIFGVFSSALATITIFSLLAGFGVSQFWLKVFGEEGWEGVRWIKPSLLFVLLTLLVITVIVFLFSLLSINDNVTGKLILLLVFYIYGHISVELVASKFQLEEKYSSLALWKLLPNFIRFIFILCCYYILNISLSLLDLGLIYAFVGLIFTVLGVGKLLEMSSGNLDLKGHLAIEKSKLRKPNIIAVFKEVWPFGVANLFAFIYVQSDIIMVKYISGDTQAGYYNVAFVILTAILIIPTILFGKFLMPKYHRWANHNKEKFYDTYKKSNFVMILTGLVIMILLFFLANILISLVFGSDYASSINLLKILALTLPISFLAYSIGATLVTKEHMKLKVLLMGVTAVINILLNVILISKYGAEGAAVSTVISNLILLTLYFAVVKKRIFIKT